MSDEAAARRLGKALREDGQRAGGASAAELQRLLWRARAQAEERGGRARWLWTALPAAALLALVFGLFALRARPDLGYQVRGVARLDEHSISAEAGEPVAVRFSDGSSLELAPGARLAVERTTPDGAQLRLFEGKALASVMHRARTRWSVAAGPFEIIVVGTRFLAHWDGQREALSVELHEGSVQVRGGTLAEPVVLRAGQRLHVSAANRTLALSEERAPPLPVAPAPVEPATAQAKTAPQAKTAEPQRSAAVPWSTLMGQGDFAAIVTQAEAMGVARCLASSSPSDLRMLADAARYLGKLELAEQSLLALRRRAPGHAAAAAFFLGRLRESRGQAREALAMYERHLVEAPRSDYAEQAMAGRLRMLVSLGDTARSQQAARSYLSRFPDGVHAAAARRHLVGAPPP